MEQEAQLNIRVEPTVENQIQENSIIWIYKNRAVDVCKVSSIDGHIVHVLNLEENSMWSVEFKDIIRVGSYVSDKYREYNTKRKDLILANEGNII